MTEQQPEKPAKGPVAPAPGPRGAQDPRDRAAELQEEIDRIRADAARGPVAMLRVVPPHDSFTYGGVSVGRDPSPVPAASVASLMGAAADAGVTLKEA